LLAKRPGLLQQLLPRKVQAMMLEAAGQPVMRSALVGRQQTRKPVRSDDAQRAPQGQATMCQAGGGWCHKAPQVVRD
jgi:hypothetical protein